MIKKLSLLVLALILTGTAVTLLAEAPAAGDAKMLGEASMEDRIDALLEMPVDQRRAELKAMSPEDRRGLWFQVKRAENERRATPAANQGAAPTRSAKSARPATKAAGTIVYDDGSITTSFNSTNAILGNRFNTHDGGLQVMNPGTVDTVVAVVVQGSAFTTSSAGFVMLGPQTGGGGAMALASTFTAGSGGPTDTVTFTGLGVTYTGNSFFVLFGAFNNSYVPAFGSGTTGGQGFHGVRGNTGGMGPNITGTTNLGGNVNGLIRVTGNVLPVELMSFDVE